MNIYFLVEGRSTEKKLYPAWLKILLPEIERVQLYNQVDKNNYVIMSGYGYPNIFNHIRGAVGKIQEIGKYDYLVVCVDADEDTVEDRKQEIKDFVRENNLELGKTKLVPIIQNRCIETWLLGNRKIFDSRQSLQEPLKEYVNYYDVSISDPELMGNYSDDYNHADFHELYLKAIFAARNIRYTKKSPGDSQESHYLKQLIKRVENQPQHLKSFQDFIDFCNQVQSQE